MEIAYKLLHPAKRLRPWYLILSGAILGACVTFPTAPGAVLEWFAMIPAALAMYACADDEKVRPFRLWALGFLFTMSEYLFVYHWFITMYPLDFTGMSRPSAVAVIIAGWVGLSILAAIAGGVCFAVAVCVSHLPVCRRHTLLRPFVTAAMFAAFEWTQTQTWLGVPWGRLSLGQLVGNFTLTVMPASVFGSYFVTFLIVAAAALLAEGLCSGRLRMRALIALSLALANLCLGTVLFLAPSAEGQTVTVAAVQGNINSRDKWDAAARDETHRRYVGYTREAAAQGADIVLYPETAYPYFVFDGGSMDTMFSELAKDCGTAIVVGCFSTSESEGDLNVLRFYDADGSRGEKMYAKRHLVPFGEYLPMRAFFEVVLKPLTEIAMLADDLEEGTETAVNEIGGVKYGSLICFDSIYETLALNSVRDGAEILLLSTNDSWFLDSRAVYMHNAQARLRAIETGCPVVRAANTGISSVIDARGRVREVLPPLVEGMILTEVTTAAAGTPYTAVGNLFVVLCAAFCLGICGAQTAFTVKEKRKKN